MILSNYSRENYVRRLERHLYPDETVLWSRTQRNSLEFVFWALFPFILFLILVIGLAKQQIPWETGVFFGLVFAFFIMRSFKNIKLFVPVFITDQRVLRLDASERSFSRAEFLKISSNTRVFEENRGRDIALSNPNLGTDALISGEFLDYRIRDIDNAQQVITILQNIIGAKG